MSFFTISVERGNESATLCGFDKNNLNLAATHRFAGALMPVLRADRLRGELTRVQYKRAKDRIESRMRDNMQHDASQSWPYSRVTMRDVRKQIRSL